MEVVGEPRRVHQTIHAEIEVSALEVTFVYRQLRSYFRLPQFEGGPYSSGDPQGEVAGTSELPELSPLPLAIRLP